ncbi:MAG: hypothetical protein QE271_04795, partial [Bacteriovoracaceae bacterium]|nr:hypothetical protein [Bacteriovoracaceae bacterium]
RAGRRMRKAYIILFLIPALVLLFFLGNKHFSSLKKGDSQNVAKKSKKKKNSNVFSSNDDLKELKKSVENEIAKGMQNREIASSGDDDSNSANASSSDPTPIPTPSENPEVLAILANLGVYPGYSLKLSLPGENVFESDRKIVRANEFDESTMGQKVGERNGMVIFIPRDEAAKKSYYSAIVNEATWQYNNPTGYITCTGNQEEIKYILLNIAELEMVAFNNEVGVAFIKQRPFSPPGRLVQDFNRLVENIPSGSKVSCVIDYRTEFKSN